MRKLWWICTAAMMGGTATAAEPMTGAEKAQVRQLATQTEQTCTNRLSTQIGKADGPFGITRDYVTNYCGCIRAGVETRVDAQMVRHGTEADGQKLIRSVAQDCAVAQFKNNFPDQCRRMFESLPRGASGAAGSEKIAAACGCMQGKVDAMNGAQLAEVTRQTVQEYQAYKRDPSYQPTLPLSLMSTFKTCAQQVAATH